MKTKKLSPKKGSLCNAFSLTEMLMTLLIVSLLLTAMAPVMTKKYKENLNVSGAGKSPEPNWEMQVFDTEGQGEFIAPMGIRGNELFVTVIGGGGGGGAAMLYTNEVKTASIWTVPSGVTSIRVFALGGGGGGASGGLGSATAYADAVIYRDYLMPGEYTLSSNDTEVMQSAFTISDPPELNSNCLASGATSWSLNTDIITLPATLNVTACGGGGGGGGNNCNGTGGGGGSGGYKTATISVLQNKLVLKIGGGGGGGGGNLNSCTGGQFSAGAGGASSTYTQSCSPGMYGGNESGNGSGAKTAGGVIGSYALGSSGFGGMDGGGGGGRFHTYSNSPWDNSGGGGGGGPTVLLDGTKRAFEAGGGGGGGGGMCRAGHVLSAGDGGGGGGNGGGGGAGGSWDYGGCNTNANGGLVGYGGGMGGTSSAGCRGGGGGGGQGGCTTGVTPTACVLSTVFGSSNCNGGGAGQQGRPGAMRITWSAKTNALKCSYNVPANGGGGGGAGQLWIGEITGLKAGDVLSFEPGNATPAQTTPNSSGVNGNPTIIKKNGTVILTVSGGLGGQNTLTGVTSGGASGGKLSANFSDWTGISTTVGGAGSMGGLAEASNYTGGNGGSAYYIKNVVKTGGGGGSAQANGQAGTGFGAGGGGGGGVSNAGGTSGSGGAGAAGVIYFEYGGTHGGGGSSGMVIDKQKISNVSYGTKYSIYVGKGGNGGTVTNGTGTSGSAGEDSKFTAGTIAIVSAGGKGGSPGGIEQDTHGLGGITSGLGSAVGGAGSASAGGYGGRASYSIATDVDGYGGCGGLQYAMPLFCHTLDPTAPSGKDGKMAGGGGGGGAIQGSQPFPGGNGALGMVVVQWLSK